MARKATPRKTRLRPATQLVHGGILRSQFGENAEAMFVTQGYVYDSAEEAAARFSGKEPGFIYSRFANPTVSMFEERMRLLEGAGAARATQAAWRRSRHVPLHLRRATRGCRAALFLCRYVVEDLLPRYGIKSTFVDAPTSASGNGQCAEHARCSWPDQSDAEVYDIAAIAERTRGGRKADRGQRLRHADPPAASCWR